MAVKLAKSNQVDTRLRFIFDASMPRPSGPGLASGLAELRPQVSRQMAYLLVRLLVTSRAVASMIGTWTQQAPSVLPRRQT